MNREHGPERSLALSFVSIRRAIGIIGVSLPFVLALGKIAIDSPGIQGSISAYYYTVMRNVFVGSLCAIAVFLISCRGYEVWDRFSGILAGVFALGVALFPTRPATDATPVQQTIGTVHVISAAAFFITIALISILLFTKTYPGDTKARRGLARLSQFVVTSTRPDRPLPRRKKARNLVYRICGYIILASIVAMFLVSARPQSAALQKLHPTFWLESLAVVAFGASWLVKGETLLKDHKSESAAAPQGRP